MNTLLQMVLYPLGWIVALSLAGMAFWRVARGPTTLDRMVGLDTAVVAMVAIVALASLQVGTAAFLEMIILITALGFFATVMFYYYLAQPKRREDEDFNEEKEGVE